MVWWLKINHRLWPPHPQSMATNGKPTDNYSANRQPTDNLTVPSVSVLSATLGGRGACLAACPGPGARTRANRVYERGLASKSLAHAHARPIEILRGDFDGGRLGRTSYYSTKQYFRAPCSARYLNPRAVFLYEARCHRCSPFQGSTACQG